MRERRQLPYPPPKDFLAKPNRVNLIFLSQRQTKGAGDEDGDQQVGHIPKKKRNKDLFALQSKHTKGNHEVQRPLAYHHCTGRDFCSYCKEEETWASYEE